MYISVLVVLLSLLICSSSGGVVIQFFVPDPNDRNAIALECIANGLPRAGATFQFFSGLDESTLQSDIFSENDRLEVTVEHTSEQFIRCVFNQEESNFLALAALPETMDFDPAIVHVFRDEEATITCPFMLGNLQEHFYPYEITWLRNEFGQGVGMTLNENDPDESFTLSDSGRELHLPMSDPVNNATYQCRLILSRCTFYDENDDVLDRCEHESPFMGPMTSLIIAERIETTVMPEDSEVMVGETANFTCNAYGSYIQISWRFNNSLLNCNESGCDNKAAIVQEHNVSNSDVNMNISIESTLEINTEGLPLRNFVIACIITQDEPDYVLGPGTPDGIFSALLMIREDSTETVPSNVTMPEVSSNPTPEPTPEPDASTQNIIIGTVVPAVIVIAFIPTIIIILVVMKRYHKKKYPINEEPDNSTESHQKHKHRDRVYEELPEAIFIHGTESVYRSYPQQSLSRQNGIAYDESNPKADNFSNHGSDDRHSKSGAGSDLSGLSGVSGNVPGAHKMPNFGYDNSVVSSSDYLIPPQLYDPRRNSVNSGQTQSTFIPPGPPTSYHPDYQYRRGSSDVYPNAASMHYSPRSRSASQGHIPANGNINLCDIIPPGSYLPDYPQPPDQVPFFPSPSHSSISGSPYHKRTDSRHSSSNSQISQPQQQISQPQQPVSDTILLTVMNCLMHNSNCEILDCPCRQIQYRYKHLKASSVPLEQKKTPERKTSSSTDSDSDTTSAKRGRMRLDLNQNRLHPHYHISTRSHVRRTSTRVTQKKRRSRSLTDLTPITEAPRETPTPQVGGAIKADTPVCDGRCLNQEQAEGHTAAAGIPLHPTKEELLSPAPLTPLGRPRPPLLREISLSSDNLPVLCLNDCLLARTPSPMKHRGKLPRHVTVLKPVRENSSYTETDDSNTSSRSNSTCTENEAKSSQSDNDEGIASSVASHSTQFTKQSMKRGESSGYESTEGGDSTLTRPLVHSKIPEGHVSPSNSFVQHSKVHQEHVSPSNSFVHSKVPQGHVSPSNSFMHSKVPQGHVSPSSRRSCSPFETATTVSSDGTVVIKTTEC